MQAPFKTRLSYLRRHAIGTRHVRPGTAPGSLGAATTDAAAVTPPARLLLMRYDAHGLVEEQALATLDALAAPAADAARVTWLHLQGRPDAAQLQALGERFGLHPLALEDVLHREARAKVEEFDGQQFVVLSQVHRDASGDFCTDQVGFFLGADYVISINQGPEDVFGPVRERIRAGSKVRAHGADYLLYALIDVIVDGAFALLEELGDRLEALEDEILDDPNREARNQIHCAKRELVQMRRAWWPQREVIAALMRDEEHWLSDTTRLYLRDCYDHCVIVIDFVETYREMTSSLLDTYLSAVTQRMNDIMKALTIIATIFLPLTFITGLYGMNFDTSSPWNLPELHWRYGYPYVLGVMSGVVIGMVIYFRRKRWL
ncbi:MAG TPA: magnesium/cobalt transporter CorA [Ottowia sp.]|uniref:magnesium/cobalt transporter CorA n=1 Tax=Ottowia sp. TaxID=1898956 RepID=UPI002B896665|nr:magnesium/cobalt transporter CorA [Ottowia sp.]HMN20826.1 magnesium/cobalt transporter CorA [Ottowia sp.]